MSYYFPLPGMNVTGFVELMLYDNSITGGIFGISILLMIFFISFISLTAYGVEKSFVPAIFMTFISSVFLAAMGLISYNIITILLFVTTLSVFLLWKFGGRD